MFCEQGLPTERFAWHHAADIAVWCVRPKTHWNLRDKIALKRRLVPLTAASPIERWVSCCILTLLLRLMIVGAVKLARVSPRCFVVLTEYSCRPSLYYTSSTTSRPPCPAPSSASSWPHGALQRDSCFVNFGCIIKKRKRHGNCEQQSMFNSLRRALASLLRHEHRATDAQEV